MDGWMDEWVCAHVCLRVCVFICMCMYVRTHVYVCFHSAVERNLDLFFSGKNCVINYWALESVYFLFPLLGEFILGKIFLLF